MTTNSFYNPKHDNTSPDTAAKLRLILESGIDIRETALDQTDWDVFYHLSDIRKNILSWIEFKQDCTILEIGAECGAITGLLCEKAKHVTATDPSKEYCGINSIRNRYDDLDIIAGRFKDIKLTCTYDYVTMIGVSAKDLKVNISKAASTLNPGGQLIVAGEGDCQVFSKLLTKAGLSNIKVYFLKPDHITTLEVSSEAGDSGSFLLIASKEPMTIDISYVKFACRRKPEFRILTEITAEGVIKRPMAEVAKAHIKQLAANKDKIAGIYNNIIPADCEIKNNSAVFPFINGEPLTLPDIDKVFDYKAPLSDFVVTDRFKEIFGDIEIPAGEKAYPTTNIDSNLDNFMTADGKTYCIDYEWIADFPVPIRFVGYRTLFYAGITPDKFSDYGFSDEDIKLFHSMETAFQQYVSGKDFRYIVTSKFQRPEPERKKHFWNR